MLAEIAGAVTALAWLHLLIGRGGFWRMRAAQPVPAEPPARRVVAVIPARDEAATAPLAVESLRKQDRPLVEIVLVDDHSGDGTAEAVRGLATVVAARALPPGWRGKLWALEEGIRRANSFHPDYLLLTDADIVHPPDNVSQLVARAEAGRYDLVSFMARLHCETTPEKLLIPAFVFFFFKLYPPAWIADPRRKMAGAAGGCILVRRAALERIGGLAAIRGELIDDCALARAVKRTGGGVWLGLSAEVRSIRAYGSFAEIGRMVSRSAFTQLRHSALLLAGTVAGMLALYLLPLALLAAQPAAAAAGAFAWLILSAAYTPALRFYGRSSLWAPLLPLAALFYTVATVHSAISYWRGRGGSWKGRTLAG